VLGYDESRDGPQRAGEKAVGHAHDGDGDVGVEEGEGEQDVAEHGHGDCDEHVGHVQAGLVDQEPEEGRRRRRDQVNQTWKMLMGLTDTFKVSTWNVAFLPY